MILKEKLWLPDQIYFRVVKTLLFVSRESISRKKHLSDLLFFHPFRTSSGENFVFRKKFFDKIVKVHSTCAEENSEENSFSDENCILSSLLQFEKKLFETSWQNSQKKFVYTYLDVLVGTLQLIFFEEIMFLFITLEIVRRNFKIHKKTFRQRFQKCIRRFLRNVSRISVVFFERNCEVSSIFDSETKLFQNFVSKLRQSGHNRNLPVELKALTESSIFLIVYLLKTNPGVYQKKIGKFGKNSMEG